MDFGFTIVVVGASATWLGAYLFAKKKEGGNNPPKTNPEWGKAKKGKKKK